MATLVINELLIYVISKLDVENVMDIKKVIITLYGEEAVNDTKTALWSAYTDTLDKPVNRRSKVKLSMILLKRFNKYLQHILTKIHSRLSVWH